MKVQATMSRCFDANLSIVAFLLAYVNDAWLSCAVDTNNCMRSMSGLLSGFRGTSVFACVF